MSNVKKKTEIVQNPSEMDSDEMALELGIAAPITQAGQMTSAEIKAAIAEGFALEQVVALKEGDQIEGRFLGRGGDVETVKQDGTPTTIPTWKLASALAPGLVFCVVGASQLNSRMSGTPVGTLVRIRKGPKTVSRRGNPVNTFFIFTKPGDTTVIDAK